MPTIDIKGTSVAFPFKPYDCQLDYIGGVLEALNDAVCSLNERCVFLNFLSAFHPYSCGGRRNGDPRKVVSKQPPHEAFRGIHCSLRRSCHEVFLRAFCGMFGLSLISATASHPKAP